MSGWPGADRDEPYFPPVDVDFDFNAADAEADDAGDTDDGSPISAAVGTYVIDPATGEVGAGSSIDAPANRPANRPATAPGGGIGSAADPTAGGTVFTDSIALASERDEYLAALQRMKADFDNFRKRVDRTQAEQSARAALDLVSKLLPVLDTLDLASAHVPTGDEASEDAKALIQARAQLLDVLQREGLERLDQSEVVFDPSVHDAVAHVPAAEQPAAGSEATGPEGAGDDAGTDADAAAPAAPAASPAGSETVVDGVLRSGYRWRGQVIRPAMVRVRD